MMVVVVVMMIVIPIMQMRVCLAGEIMGMAMAPAENLARDQPKAKQRHQCVGDDPDPVGGNAHGDAFTRGGCLLLVQYGC